MRWWGRGKDGLPLEVDIVAGSSDKKTLVIGEAKWSEKTNPITEYDILQKKIFNLPFVKGQKIIPVLFLKNRVSGLPEEAVIFDPEAVVNAFR